MQQKILSKKIYHASLIISVTISIAFLIAFTSNCNAESLDELASFCSKQGASLNCGLQPRIKSRVTYHRIHSCKRHHVHKRRKHHVKHIKTAKNVIAEPIVTSGGLYIIEENPRACFIKLLTGDKYEVDLLPPCFKVYVNKTNVVKLQPEPDFEIREVPIFNLFLRTPGCYIACLSHNPDKQVYALAEGIYMVGSIRVKGSYESGYCVPDGYESRDIRGDSTITDLCSKSFSCIGNSCWGFGQTGGWFGVK